MSLDLDFILDGENVFWVNVTHNLTKMATACNLYDVMWCPGDHGFETAGDMIDVLILGLSELLRHPEYYKKFNPGNGWGDYDGFVDTVLKIIKACGKYPDAKVEVWR